MAVVRIFVGTVFGNAQQVAEHAIKLFAQAGHDAQIAIPEQAEFIAEGVDLLLICTSTTGQRDIPDDLVPLFVGLRDTLPQLPGRKAAVVGLGDSSYDNFAGGGRQFIDLFEEMGLPLAQEPLIIDACEDSDPVAASRDWLTELAGKI